MEVRLEASDVFQLAWWWALWSLADTYFLRYTPCSEILVVCACVVWWAWPHVRHQVKKGGETLKTGLEKVTMTSDI